jgi:hypothetical protein
MLFLWSTVCCSELISSAIMAGSLSDYPSLSFAVNGAPRHQALLPVRVSLSH